MNYETEIAKNFYEFFKNMRETIRHEGMNNQRFTAIITCVNVISIELKKGFNIELDEIRSMGLSLIQRQHIL